MQERRAKMANQTTIGELAINLQMKLDGLEKGIETAKKKLQEMEQQNNKMQQSNKGLDASFIAMSATIVASLMKIKSAVDSGVQEYKKYESANKGLESIVKGQGLNFSEAKSFIEEYISDGLIPLGEATLAYKNLAARGYNEEQIKKTMLALKDAAAFGRQSTYEYGEAIATATEGLKNENSILVDNAGVTKNVAKMWEDYAKSIGKTSTSLTQEEKIQAEVNGIIEESKNQVGDAAKYAETYAGQQAQLNAANIELSKTFGEAMLPVLSNINNFLLSGAKGLAEFTAEHKEAVSGTIAFATALGATVLVLTTAKKAYIAYTAAAEAANMTTKAFTVSLMKNPITLAAVAIASAAAYATAWNTKMQETIDLLEEKTQKVRNVSEALDDFNKNREYTDTETTVVEDAVKETEEIVKTYEERASRLEEIKNRINEIESKSDWNTSAAEYEELRTLKQELKNAEKSMQDFEKEHLSAGQTMDYYRKRVETLSKTLEVSNAKKEYDTKTNIKAQRQQLINIAQTQADINGKRELLNVLKQGKTETEEYTNAKSQLVKVYPELAKVNDNTIASTEANIDAEERAAQAEWALAQATIMNSIAELTAMQNNDALVQNIAVATQQKVEDVRASIVAATQSLAELSKMSIDDFKGSVTSTYTPKKTTRSSGSSTYSNKKLDNYKKEIEYKKSLDQLSLQQEMSMYETALKKYAKTTDEKRELTTKLYELRKELQEKELDDYTANIEHMKALDKLSLQEEINRYEYAYKNLAKTTEQKKELEETLYELRKELAQKEKDILDKKTADYENYIQEQKNLRGAEYDVKDRKADLDKIIKMHQDYLNRILKDERLSLDERKEIYEEELQTIRDYEQQKRDLRVEAIDNTVSQLKEAITKQLEEMHSTDKETIEKNIKLVEEWKEARINAINEEYNARIKAIEDELNALDKAEQDKSRQEEDAEYERKKNRLEQLIAFEHDAVTKANYQKELDKLIADYQKTLDKRALQDKKDALNAQKDLLEEEQDNKVQAIEDEAEKQKEAYDKQLEDLDEYYNKQIEMAQETAEKMLLNVQKNQDEIINLLSKYGDKYEITGQSLGEKLAQGINNGLVGSIEAVIQKIQDKLDAAIENQIAKFT